eukprot:2224834-Rhodomonas_salina.3
MLCDQRKFLELREQCSHVSSTPASAHAKRCPVLTLVRPVGGSGWRRGWRLRTARHECTASVAEKEDDAPRSAYAVAQLT